MNLYILVKQVIWKKIGPMITNIRKFFSPTYIKSKLKVHIRETLTKLFDFKPKDKHDYYTIGRWMLAKKLAFSIVVALLLVNAFVLSQVLPAGSEGASGYKTYAYNSYGLKFYEGNVHILNEDNNVAYTGTVKDGQVEGQGLLYDAIGTLVYEGAFSNNQYNGVGTLYEEGMLLYVGDFVNNVYQGSGILYRVNGSKLYEGEFLDGKKDGAGELYDTSGKVVYTGNFSNDNLKYEEIVGKTTAEVSEVYTGDKTIYTYDDEFSVYMEDIDALYVGASEESIEDNGWPVTGVYVLYNSFSYGKETYTSVSDIEKALGTPQYEGNTTIESMEAIAMKILEDNGNTLLSENLAVEMSVIYEDSIEMTSYDNGYYIYIHQFYVDDFIYTFYCNQPDGSFAMYLIEEAS